MTSRQVFVVGAAIVLGSFNSADAQVPEQINYQGRLVDGTNLVSGPVSLVLQIHTNAIGGSPVYEDSNTVVVVDGLYSTFIGDNPTPGFGALSDALVSSGLYLEVTVDGTTLSPREEIASAAFALRAGGLPDGMVTSQMLAEEAVDEAGLASNSVTSAKILNGSIADADISTDAAIAASKIDTAGLDADSLDGIDGTGFLRSDADDTAAGRMTFSATPVHGADDGGPVFINPATANANDTLLGISVGGDQRFRINENGDLHLNSGSDLFVSGSGALTFSIDHPDIVSTLDFEVDADDTSFTGDVAVGGDLQVGFVLNTAPYSRLGLDSTGHGLDAADDLLVSDDLEVNGDLYADGSVTVAGTVAAAGFVGSGAGLTGVIPADDSVGSAQIADGAVTSADVASNTFWETGGNTGTAGGGVLGTTDDRAFQIRVNNRRAMHVIPNSESPILIGGHESNTVFNEGGTIGGGGSSNRPNRIQARYATISGGEGNRAGGGAGSAQYSSIGGGFSNQTQSTYNTIAGGQENLTESTYSTVGGGAWNRSEGGSSTVGGGEMNVASNSHATVAGGTLNVASGQSAAIPGGMDNLAAGATSLAAGNRAKALHDGVFVWADTTAADFSSTAANQFLVRASGGVGIGTSVTPEMLTVAGTVSATSFSGDGSTLTSVNADTLDSVQGASYLRSDTSDSFTTGTLTVDPIAKLDVNGTLRMDGTVTKASSTKVANFNADYLDDRHATDFLRSNTSDTYALGTLTMDPGTLLDVNGTLRIGHDSGVDDDPIYFDSGQSEWLNWDDSDTRFTFSDDIAFSGAFQAGSLSGTVSYNRCGTGSSNRGLVGPDHLFVTGVLEVDSSILADGDIGVGTGAAGDDDTIYFDLGTAEWFRWDGANARFELSDNLAVESVVQIGSLGGGPLAYNRFGTDLTSHGLDAASDVLVSDDLEVNGDLHVDATLFANGDLSLAGSSGNDNDTIYFDSGTTEALSWDNAQARFELSDELALAGVLVVGSAAWAPVTYNAFGDPAQAVSADMNNENDLFVRYDVEVGQDCYLNKKLYMEGDSGAGSDGDQSIYFYEAGVRTGERLFWDDSAGRFEVTDDLSVVGTLSKSAGAFIIDHPLDPANKYLRHSFVESPDMKNVYDGVAALDSAGAAQVLLPEWFGALNRDFRYQLTPIGAPAPDLHVAEEIADNRFKIAGGAPGMKVSWQVTGIRQDPYANAHRIPVEEEKPAEEKGHYLHPGLHGEPDTMGIDHARMSRPVSDSEELNKKDS